MFQNLRANSQIYILHKDAKPYVEVAIITGVTPPKPKYPVGIPQVGQLPHLEMVVDLTAQVGGRTDTYQALPAGAEIADFGQNGNMVISCSREAMNSEISAMKQRSLEIINSVQYHQGVIAGCDEMLNALNPEYAEKQRQDKEISDLKRQMAELMEMNRQMMQQLNVHETPSPESITNKKVE